MTSVILLASGLLVVAVVVLCLLHWREEHRSKQQGVPPAGREASGREVPGATTLRLSPDVTMEFVRIEPGSFAMGSPDEPYGNFHLLQRGWHRVTISRPFYLGKYEVTQAQWVAVMGSSPSGFKKGGDYPVEQVSWNDCQEFIARLNAKHPGRGFRLPTEAEWEYACRAGSSRAGSTGARHGDLDRIAWHRSNSGDSTHRVGTKEKNAFGLYGMLDNVREWCEDWYGAYPNGAVTDPPGPRSGSYRVIRRGCVRNFADRVGPSLRGDDLGFRLASSSP